MKKIDLHSHSTASDGIYTPSNLIAYAVKMGVETLALTDHDTVGGIDEALEYASKIGFKLIPGIEFSIDYTGGTFHLVGLFIDHKNPELLDVIDRLNEIRDNRAVRIIEDLASHDIIIPLEEVIEESGGGAVGRPHVARVMVRHGFGDSINEIFQNYLVKGKPGYVKKERISLSHAVQLIKNSGGIPFIAHPITLNFDDFSRFEEMLKGFVKEGVEGIEAFAALHSKSEVEEFARIAGKYNLLVSGGSDFHGDKDEKIGFYSEDEPVPSFILDEMIAFLKRQI